MTIFKHPLNKPQIPSPNTTLFPSLPLELRSQIYFDATSPLLSPLTISAADFIFGRDPRLPYFLPKLCHVNETTRIDVGLWFLRTTEFSLLYAQHVGYFAKFLDTFPGRSGWEAVRRVEFPLFGRHPVTKGQRNAYIEFLVKCTGLTEVSIKFEVWWVLKKGLNSMYDTSVEGEEVLSRDMIVERYGLEDMLDLPSLSTLTIEVWPKVIKHTKQGIKLEVPDCWPVLESLALWIREGFKKREGTWMLGWRRVGIRD